MAGLAGLNRKAIRQRALAYVDSSDDDNHYGSMVNNWINDGLQEMCGEGEGNEKIITMQTVVSKRSYPLPQAFMRPKMVTWKGYQLFQVPMVTMDFFTSGTSQLDRYAFWNAPDLQIILGPRPPSEAAALVIYYTSEAQILTNDQEEPDIPNRYRHDLAKYAAAQIMMADGNTQECQELLKQWEKAKQKYHEWVLYGGRENFRSVRVEVPY